MLLIGSASVAGLIAVVVTLHRSDQPLFEDFGLVTGCILAMVLVGGVMTTISIKLGKSYREAESLGLQLFNALNTLADKNREIEDLKRQLREALAANDANRPEDPS